MNASSDSQLHQQSLPPPDAARKGQNRQLYFSLLSDRPMATAAVAAMLIPTPKTNVTE
jgi:hypothetical protein